MHVDFADLKSKVNISQVIELLGIHGLAPKGDQLAGQCPFCNNKSSFKVTLEKGTFYCFHERKGGDLIRLAARKLDTDDRAAAEHIATHLLNGAGKADDNARPQQEAVADGRKSSDFDPLAYVKTLDPEHEALKELDILPETLIAFKAGFSSKGLNRGRLAVAWHDNSGTIRVFIGVALDGTLPKYLVPKGNPLPYWFGCNALEAEQEVRIVPDILDVLRAHENGAENVIAPVAPVNELSLCALATLCKEKKLTVEF